MTSQPPARRHRQIRQALRSPRAGALPPRVRLLAQATWGVRGNPIAHVRCLAELPSYVDAEMDGALAARRRSFVREHLLTCTRCALDYAELLEIAILDSHGLFEHHGSPPPDLSFLESPND